VFSQRLPRKEDFTQWEDFTLMVWSPGPVLIGVVVLAALGYYLAPRPEPGLHLMGALVELTYLGMVAAFFTVVWAEWTRRAAAIDVDKLLAAQSLYGAAVVLVGAAVGAVAARRRIQPLYEAPEFDRLAWLLGAVIVLWACVRIATATKRLVLEGEFVAATLQASERDAHAVRIRALQLKAEPDLVLRAMTAIADRAVDAPADAERAVEALAAFLRKGLKEPSEAMATIAMEVARTREYLDVLAVAGLAVPLEWTVDNDARDIEVPSGTLRTFVDYAVARCQRDSNEPTIAVRVYCHAGRVYLIVSDTAAPDPPTLAEPAALTALRERTGAPPQRRVRVETSVMLQVDGTTAGTVQTFSMRTKAAA
jgi:hypothetical protein